jgi:cytoskeleton protein RodZ
MAAPLQASGFGARLREAREGRGITLRQIANATKISVSALEALEHDDFARLPWGIFSRGFVRSYAAEVGLDPEETIRDFITQFPGDAVTAGHPEAEQIEASKTLESDRRVTTTFVRLVALSLPVVGLVLYYGTGRSQTPRTVERALGSEQATVVAPRASSPAVESAGGAEAPMRVATPAEAVPPAVPASGAPALQDSVGMLRADVLSVKVSLARSCWVSARVDGQKATERLMQPGDERTFEVRSELIFTAGDAGAVTWTLNGARGRPLGKSGEVTTIRVTRANFADFLLSP